MLSSLHLEEKKITILIFSICRCLKFNLDVQGQPWKSWKTNILIRFQKDVCPTPTWPPFGTEEMPMLLNWTKNFDLRFDRSSLKRFDHAGCRLREDCAKKNPKFMCCKSKLYLSSHTVCLICLFF